MTKRHESLPTRLLLWTAKLAHSLGTVKPTEALMTLPTDLSRDCLCLSGAQANS